MSDDPRCPSVSPDGEHCEKRPEHTQPLRYGPDSKYAGEVKPGQGKRSQHRNRAARRDWIGGTRKAARWVNAEPETEWDSEAAAQIRYKYGI